MQRNRMMKTLAILIAALGLCHTVTAQNMSMNILVRNSGKVITGETVMLEITVCNLNASVTAPVYRLRPQISVPATVVIADAGHVLPTGWSIVAGKDAQVWLSNGTDSIAGGDCRTILIALTGIKTGASSTVSGNLLFSNGVAPGNVRGTSLPGDVPEDNHSTSTVEVLAKGKQ